MNDPVLAQGSGLVVRRGRHGERPLEVVCVGDSAAYGWLGVTEDQLRWLAEVGVPAALAALQKPAPATEGPTP